MRSLKLSWLLQQPHRTSYKLVREKGTEDEDQVLHGGGSQPHWLTVMEDSVDLLSSDFARRCGDSGDAETSRMEPTAAPSHVKSCEKKMGAQISSELGQWHKNPHN